MIGVDLKTLTEKLQYHHSAEHERLRTAILSLLYTVEDKPDKIVTFNLNLTQ